MTCHDIGVFNVYVFVEAADVLFDDDGGAAAGVVKFV